MSRKFLHAVSLAAALFAAGAAGAQSLKATRAQEADESQLSREVAYTNSVCGLDMRARIDWRSADDWPAGASLVDACDRALGAVEASCRGKGGARIGSPSVFVCAGDGTGPSLSGGTLRYGAAPGIDSFADMRAFLGG